MTKYRTDLTERHRGRASRNPAAPDSASAPSHDVGEVAHALANPRRRGVISRLCRGPATTTELAEAVGAALPTMHQHLDVLQRAGIVQSAKQGRTVTHTLDVAPMEALGEWIERRRSFWTNQLAALDESFARSTDREDATGASPGAASAGPPAPVSRPGAGDDR